MRQHEFYQRTDTFGFCVYGPRNAISLQMGFALLEGKTCLLAHIANHEDLHASQQDCPSFSKMQRAAERKDLLSIKRIVLFESTCTNPGLQTLLKSSHAQAYTLGQLGSITESQRSSSVQYVQNTSIRGQVESTVHAMTYKIAQ